jgi:hypothetical protein
MPKSKRTQIIEKVASSLTRIKAGNAVPNLTNGGSHTFLSTARSVNRAMSELNADKFPALFVVDPIETGRHLLADVLQQTLQVTVAGEVHSQDVGSAPLKNSVEQLDDLLDDTRAVLVSDPSWGGLARRSRIPRLEADTSTDDHAVAFAASYEIDYIEVVDDGSGSAIILPLPLPVDSPGAPGPYTQPYGETVYNALFNAFLHIPNLKWVERARNWPMPLEQVSARFTPGIWFHESNEQYQYNGSTDTKKLEFVTALLLAVDTTLATFPASIDHWVAALKDCLGTYADLGGTVLTVDLLSIRTERSEFPVVAIELDLQIMYLQSFLTS